jgi:hypothetical protein
MKLYQNIKKQTAKTEIVVVGIVVAISRVKKKK